MISSPVDTGAADGARLDGESPACPGADAGGLDTAGLDTAVLSLVDTESGARLQPEPATETQTAKRMAWCGSGRPPVRSCCVAFSMSTSFVARDCPAGGASAGGACSVDQKLICIEWEAPPLHWPEPEGTSP